MARRPFAYGVDGFWGDWNQARNEGSGLVLLMICGSSQLRHRENTYTQFPYHIWMCVCLIKKKLTGAGAAKKN